MERYLANINFHVWADSEVEALEKINEITRYLDMEKDAKTYLTEFWFVPYAEPTKHRQLDIREISNKLGE